MAGFLKAENYPSLQAAVDASAPWETVVVPPGEWECGALKLKSNLIIRLEAGAVLRAPRELDACLPADMFNRETSLTHCFFGGFGIENVIIEGDGMLECSGDAFWENYDNTPSPADAVLPHQGVYRSAPYRPSAMLFVNCRNITLRGFTIRNSAAYTVWMVGCETVRIERITIRNHRRGPNTDGLDIDCCRDVWIDGCDINAGDDCIALKSDIVLLGRDQACERINVSNCLLSSPCCAVRLGYEGDGVIRDVIIADSIIHDCNKGFDLISVVPAGQRFGISRGSQIENILFRDAVMRNVRQAMAVWSGTDEPADEEKYQGSIRNLRFSDLEIDATDSSFFGGLAVSEVALNNIRMCVRRNPFVYRNVPPVGMPNVWGHGYLPNPLTFFRVAELALADVRISEKMVSPD